MGEGPAPVNTVLLERFQSFDRKNMFERNRENAMGKYRKNYKF